MLNAKNWPAAQGSLSSFSSYTLSPFTIFVNSFSENSYDSNSRKYYEITTKLPQIALEKHLKVNMKISI